MFISVCICINCIYVVLSYVCICINCIYVVLSHVCICINCIYVVLSYVCLCIECIYVVLSYVVYVSIVYMLEEINNLFIYLSIQCVHVLGILNMVYFESPRVQLILKKNKAAKHLSFSQQRLG